MHQEVVPGAPGGGAWCCLALTSPKGYRILHLLMIYSIPCHMSDMRGWLEGCTRLHISCIANIRWNAIGDQL